MVAWLADIFTPWIVIYFDISNWYHFWCFLVNIICVCLERIGGREREGAGWKAIFAVQPPPRAPHSQRTHQTIIYQWNSQSGQAQINVCALELLDRKLLLETRSVTICSILDDCFCRSPDFIPYMCSQGIKAVKLVSRSADCILTLCCGISTLGAKGWNLTKWFLMYSNCS